MALFNSGDRVIYYTVWAGVVQSVDVVAQTAFVKRDGSGFYDTVPFADLTLIEVVPVDPSNPPSGGFDFGWVWPFIVIATGIRQAAIWLWRNTFGRLFGR